MAKSISELVTASNEAFQQIIEAPREELPNFAADYIAASTGLHEGITAIPDGNMLYVLEANLKSVADQVSQIAQTFGEELVMDALAPVVETWHLRH